jgi:DNA topoisomerase IA
MSGGYVIVAEKPSVARALSWALKDVPNLVFSSVRGHVYEADLPVEFMRWSLSNLSSIFDVRRLRSVVSDRRSYSAVKEAFLRNPEKALVVATDNDHEGCLIGSEILRIYRSVRGSSAPYFRMRFNSTAPQDLRFAWQKLETTLNQGWVSKAVFRQTFDLLTGAAFTRLLTLGVQRKQVRQLISYGSCQTPVLYFVVEREREIHDFVSVKYWVLKALLETERGERFEAATERIQVADDAEKTCEAVKNADEGIVANYTEEKTPILRPLPLRTDDALRDLTRITGVPAARLLSIMEMLYSSGFITYPRTETNKYAEGFNFSLCRKAAEAAGILVNMLGVSATANPRNGSLDDGAHPPICPVKAYVKRDPAGRVWEYVARRFIANAYMENAEQLAQRAAVNIEGALFHAAGRSLTKTGFFDMYPYFRGPEVRLPVLSPNEKVKVLRVDLIEDETKPPPRLAEAELLRKMEAAGIGTDATRASFPTLIVKRGYAVRGGKVFKPTALGMSLIEALTKADKRLVTPETRRLVEEKMRLIEKEPSRFDDALNDVTETYKRLFQKCHSCLDTTSEKLAKVILNSGAPLFIRSNELA